MRMDGPSAMDGPGLLGGNPHRGGERLELGDSDRSAVSRLAPAQPGVNTRSRRMF